MPRILPVRCGRLLRRLGCLQERRAELSEVRAEEHGACRIEGERAADLFSIRMRTRRSGAVLASPLALRAGDPDENARESAALAVLDERLQGLGAIDRRR